MRHLVGVVSALVDAHLPAAETERLLAHAVGCLPCRMSLADERNVKAALVEAPAPMPPVELVRRLLKVASGPSAIPQAGEGPQRL